MEKINETSTVMSGNGSPDLAMRDNSKPKERLAEIAQLLKNGKPVPPVTVRAFLSWFFRFQRRGRWIVSYIRSALMEANLKTVPDFESAYLDAEMKFDLATTSLPAGDDSTIQPNGGELITITDQAQVRVVAETSTDPTYRISKLAAANKTPVFVNPDSSLMEAVTIMMANGFSQIPVMISQRDVKGVVSWKSIASRLSLGQPIEWAREAMDRHVEISSDTSLFTAIPVIVEHEYVLVRGANTQIAGIITTSDLSLQFLHLSEPFLLLGEIENHVRRIIDAWLDCDDIAAVKDPSDGDRSVERASDLTFGEYIRLLEKPTTWAKLKMKIDRSVFIKLLDTVRTIRNDVMHFDPDGITNEALAELRDFANFLRVLQTIGVT